MLLSSNHSGIPVWIIQTLFVPTSPDEDETSDDEIKVYSNIGDLRNAIIEIMNGMLHDIRTPDECPEIFNDLDHFTDEYLNTMPFTSSSNPYYDVIELYTSVGITIIYRAYIDSVL